MRILLVSVAPWAPSGYGTQARQLARRLKNDGHEVGFFALYGLKGGTIWWEGMPVFPHASDAMGNDIILGHVDAFKPDIVLSLHDTWPMTQYGGRLMRWIPWTPVDHTPTPPGVLSAMSRAWRVVSMSQFGAQQLAGEGVPNTYIPLGIDAAFYPDAAAGRAWRKDHDIPPEAFVYGMAGLNVYWPPRKGYDRAIEAFAQIHAEHPDTILYLHTAPQAMQVPNFDLWQVIDFHKIPHEAIRFSDSYPLFMGYTEAGMRAMYNSFDVLLQPTQGEGFGLPVMEAQACGVPVIATNCTTMPELVFEELGILVEPSDRYLSLGYAWQYEIGVPGLVAGMEEAYQKLRQPCKCGRADCDGYPWRKILNIHSKQYQWDTVYGNFWRPFLLQIKEEIGASPESLLPANVVLEEEIGTGHTSASVYRGTVNGRQAVIKIDNGAYYGDMAREIALLQRLDHPLIPKVLASGLTGIAKRPWFAMEYRGQPLKDCLDFMGGAERLKVYHGIEAVARYLHTEGVVHRDIKLDNIVVFWPEDLEDGSEGDWQPALVDFGWAIEHTYQPASSRPVLCPDLTGRGPDELPDVTAGNVGTGLPVLLAEIMQGLPEGEVTLSQSTGSNSTVAYTSVPGLNLPAERDSDVRWAMLKDAGLDFKDSLVVDLGCNLGYFCGKTLEEGAVAAFGVDADPAIVQMAGHLYPQGMFSVLNLDRDNLDRLANEVAFAAASLHPARRVVLGLSVIMHLQSPGRFWKLVKQLNADILVFEPPAAGEYSSAASHLDWLALLAEYGWNGRLLGYTDRNRPLFLCSPTGVPAAALERGAVSAV